MTNKSMTPKIDARNGCYGNEEATADDGVQEVSKFGAERATAGEQPPTRSSTKQQASARAMTSAPIHRFDLPCPAEIQSAGETYYCQRNGHDDDNHFWGPKAPPKYDGTLLPTMTAMVTGFAVEQSVIRAEERAKLFRETTGTFLPDMICRNAACGKVSSTLFSCHLCAECKDRCQECYDEHMEAGHESDSSTAREMYHGMRLIK